MSTWSSRAVDETDGRLTIVIATRDRASTLAQTLEHHRAPTILVDNGSSDGTADFVRRNFPQVRTIESPVNLGAAGRTLGTRLAETPYVAFADDDSFWAPGALRAAADVLDRHPQLGVLAARVLVGDEQRSDPTNDLLRESPLGWPESLPGPRILGFLACASVVRRTAYLQVGGFSELLFFFGEEELLALDLMTHGWELSYLDSVVVHHFPQAQPAGQRGALGWRNSLLTAAMRRPARVVLRMMLNATADRHGRAGLLAAVPKIRLALAERRPLPPHIEAVRARLDSP